METINVASNFQLESCVQFANWKCGNENLKLKIVHDLQSSFSPVHGFARRCQQHLSQFKVAISQKPEMHLITWQSYSYFMGWGKRSFLDQPHVATHSQTYIFENLKGWLVVCIGGNISYSLEFSIFDCFRFFSMRCWHRCGGVKNGFASSTLVMTHNKFSPNLSYRPSRSLYKTMNLLLCIKRGEEIVVWKFAHENLFSLNLCEVLGQICDVPANRVKTW